MVAINNGILLNHRKEWNWVICSDVDEPRACYTDWSKSERKTNIVLHINTYMWNLEKWYSRNKDRDIENKHMDTKVGKGGGGRNWGWHIYTTVIKWRTNENLLSSTGNSVLHGDLEGWGGGWVRGALEREGIYAYLWLSHGVVQQKPTQHYKAIILQLNKFKK